jgi:hypothetical protein
MFPTSRIVCLTEETIETLYFSASKTASPGSLAMLFGRHGLAVRSYA